MAKESNISYTENNSRRLSIVGCKPDFPHVHFNFNALSFLEEKQAVECCITVLLDHRQGLTSELQGRGGWAREDVVLYGRWT